MAAHEDAELVRSGYEAFSKGDMDTVTKLFAPDIRWNIPGRNQIAGTYNGHEEVFAFFGRIMELTAGTFSVEIHDLMASDDHVVVLVKETAERGAARLNSNEAHIWHLADGVAQEYWALPLDAHAADVFWE